MPPRPVPEVIVMGCLTVDSVVAADGRYAAGVCAGNAIYAAIGARVWLPSVGVVARIGTDYPSSALPAFAAAGLDLSGLRRLPSVHALRVAFSYSADGSRARSIPPEALATMPPALRPAFVDTTHDEALYRRFSPHARDIPRRWRQAVRAVHLPALRLERQTALAVSLRRARPDLLITCDSPGHEAFDVAGIRSRRLFEAVDAVLPGSEDIGRQSGDEDPAIVARRLLRAGARLIVLKQGSAGSIVFAPDGAGTEVPAFPARVVDPTGAGDAFCGGFVAGLLQTGDPVEATIRATASASFVIETDGPRLDPIEVRDAVQRRDTIAAGVRPWLG